ncbi:MAG TPA: hypothetical protein VIT64_12695, partial [Ilumatobacteraceae bacterium]
MSAPALLAAALVAAIGTGLRVAPRLLVPARRLGVRLLPDHRRTRWWRRPRLTVAIRRSTGS